jgi:isopenicillin N synthase-like dioxygenase
MPQDGEFLADLSVISYEKLLRKDPTEASNLLSACVKWGFFYLDLSSLTAENYRNLVSSLNRVSQKYFSRPLEEKLKDSNEEWGVFNICG